MIHALSFKMAYRHVRARWRQMALSVVAVALGVALVVGIQLMNTAVLESFLDTADAMAGRADLTISAGPGLTFGEEIADAAAAVPGVKLAVPLVRGVAFPDDGSGELLTVHGVDLANDAAVRLYHTRGGDDVVGGDLVEFLNRPDAIILGREFALRRGLQVEERIPLVTPRGVESFVIKGLLDPEGLAQTLGGRLVVMDLFAAERAFATEGQISQIDVVVEQGWEPEAVRAALEEVVPAGLRIEEPALRKSVIRKTVSGFQLMIAAFGLLAVLAGFVICYSRLSAVFEARTWQVGLMRAVGLSRGVVFGELLKESLLLGLSGTLVGLGFGVTIGHYGLPLLAATTALVFRAPIPAVQVPLLYGNAVRAGVFVGVLAAVSAAVIPALRLARKQPVAALRLRGREMPAAIPVRRWMVRLVVLGLLVAALVSGQRISAVTALGHATTALMAVGVLLTAVPIVALGGRVLTVVWGGIFGPTGRFAGKHVQWQPRRSALTVATLGIGLGATLLFGLLGWSFERTLIAQVASRLKADLVITSAFVAGGWVNAPLDGEIVDALRALPAIHAVAGEKRADVAYRGQVAVLDAYDPVCFRDTRVCEWPLTSGVSTSAKDDVASGSGAIVSTAFAHKFGTRLGETLEFPSPHGTQGFRVVGITRSEPETAVIVSRDRYRESWNDTHVTWVHVALNDGRDTAIEADAIARRLGRQHRLLIRSGSELIDYFASQARQAFSLLYLMEAVALLLVVVGIGDTLAAGVMERTRRFATMRALGMSSAQVFRLVLLEGGTIGLLGLVLATVVGLALGFFWVTIQFPAILGWKLDVHFPYAFALSAAALTLVLCLLGSLLPSLRAARIPVARALRND